MCINWIWQQPDWPYFDWDNARVQPRLRHVRLQLGVLIGKSSTQGKEHRTLDTLLSNILSSSAIENEVLNAQSVRSSLARRLRITEQQPYPVSDQSEGLAQMMLDAIENTNAPLTLTRLCTWHHWLFPNEDHSLYTRPVRVGQLRGDEPMQVISGRVDRPVVHFEAPPKSRLSDELTCFLEWFQHSQTDASFDPLLRAAMTHLWFVTLHPFDDGNGRITRALTDMALAQADQQSIRLYSMSVAILKRRNEYYQILETSQRGDMNITDWLLWFLDVLEQTLDQSIADIDRTLTKTRFWQTFHDTGLNTEQTKVINRLLDGGENGFDHGINATQYRRVAKVSKSTATRHLADLLEKGCLEKMPGGGRSTRYHLPDGFRQEAD